MKSIKFKFDLQNQVALTSKNIVLSQISTKVYTQAITQLVNQIDDLVWFQLWDQIGDDLNAIR
jgi:hypothetical protein